MGIEYERPPTTFGEMIAPFPPEVRATALWVRDVIRAEFPQVLESIHGGTKVANALYGVGRPDRVALGIQPGARFVKLFVHDPDHLGETPFRLEGRGRHMRHVKLSEPPVELRGRLVDLMRIPVDRRS
jgi:hypothetical protein